MSSLLSKKDMPLGWAMHVACVKAVTDFNHRVNEHFIWIDEVIAEAKKTLTTDTVELLPKTPSSKKTRRRVNKRTSSGDTVVPKRALRSSNRLSSQNSLDLSADGNLPKRKPASCDLDTIDELGANVKGAKVRIVDDDCERTENAIGSEQFAVSLLSKCLHYQLEEVTKELNEKESAASAKESENLKLIEVNKPVAQEGTRKKRKAADTEKKSKLLDASERENASNKETVTDDKLLEETEAVGNKTKRAKTSVKDTSVRSRTKVCDVLQEVVSKFVPEEEAVSTNALAEFPEVKKSERLMEQTESIPEENGATGKHLLLRKMADRVEDKHDESVREITNVLVKEKGGMDETQKESGTGGIGTADSAYSDEGSTVPGDSGKDEEMLVDSVFEDDDQKVNLFEDSLECAQKLDLGKKFVQQSVSAPDVELSSSSVRKSVIVNPTDLSVLAECRSLVVSAVKKPEQTFSKLMTVGLSNDKVSEGMFSEFEPVDISEAQKVKAAEGKSQTLSISEDIESEVIPAGLRKVANKAEQTASVSCLLFAKVVSYENEKSCDNSKTVPLAANSLLVSSSRSKVLLSSSIECSKSFHKTVPVVVSPTKSSDDSPRVVFKATSSSSKSSVDFPKVISTVSASSTNSSGDSPAATTTTAITMSSGNSPTVIPTVASLCSISSGGLSAAVSTVAPSSGKDVQKVILATCSSFTTWEPVSSVTDNAVVTSAVASSLPNRSKAGILKQLPSADSVDATSIAGISPSRIFMKVDVKCLSDDVNNSEMPAMYKMPQALDSPVKLDLNSKSICDNASVELSSSPVCPSPLANVAAPACHIMDPLTADVEPGLDPIKITRNESKFFPNPGSLKSPEHELNHQGDNKNASSPLKRFYSKMKLKLGSILGGQGQTNSPTSSVPRPLVSVSIARSLSRSFKTASPSKQENAAASSSPGKLCTAPIEDMEVDIMTVQGLSPNPENISSSPVGVNTTKTKRKSKGRKSNSRRSSVHARLSTSRRRSSATGGKSRLSGPQKSRLSNRLLSSLKRKMSRTPAVSTPIKENVLVRNDASLADDGTPFRNTRSKKKASVAAAAANEGQDQEACCSRAPLDSEANEVSDDDAVCDTPPVAMAKSKVQLDQTMGGNTKMMIVDEESNANQGSAGTPVSAAADCQTTQAPSTLKQKRPLGSRIKMLQDMICQSPAFLSKNKRKKSNSSITSNASGVTGGVKTRKLGLWSTSQRRVSLKRANKSQKSKTDSQRTDLNDSALSNTGGASSVSVFASCGSAGRTPTHPSSFLNLLSKKPSSSSVVSSGSVKSFIPHNTPVKMNREEQDEQKRNELEAKKKKLEEAEQRKQEQRSRKAEELKRQREERQMLAQKRREERQQKDLEQKREMMLKLEETSKASSRAAEERLREEREKQKLREKRIADAEQRRKHEEGARQQMALQLEKERELFEEQQRLKRELEDQERQQKITEQRRQEEERRKLLERERLAEQERLRLLEEQKQKEEQEKQRQKEEREKKEKAERDRLEVERQRERERQRQNEIEKQREVVNIKERQRLVLKQVEGEEPSLKDKTFMKLLEKHNQNLKSNSTMSSNTVLGIIQSAAKSTSTAACTAAARFPATAGSALKGAPLPSASYAAPASVAKPVVKGCSTTAAANKGATLASVVAEHDSDSYDMTPVLKVRKPASDENYDIADLNSDDSTDDESKPRKKIPLWAQGTQLRALLIKQFTHPPDVDHVFGPIYALDLNEVFNKKKPRFNKRTSSAAWDEPLLPKPASLKY